MEIYFAPDVKELVRDIVENLELKHIDSERVICMRTSGSKSDALARIYSFERIWQKALSLKPYYIIEVLSQKYDKLPDEEKEKTIIHELLHVPKTFSGALVPHKCFGVRRVGKRIVDKLYAEYRAKKVTSD